MNIKNNKRRQATRDAISKAFIALLQEKELSRITVAEICARTGYNRSTFYANYEDIYALADGLRAHLEQEVERLYAGNNPGMCQSDSWLRLFTHIRDNQLFYSTYFKLGYDTAHDVNLGELTEAYRAFPAEHMGYHVAFFKAGFNAMVKKWLREGCRETPEEMSAILKAEYRGRMD